MSLFGLSHGSTIVFCLQAVWLSASHSFAATCSNRAPNDNKRNINRINTGLCVTK